MPAVMAADLVASGALDEFFARIDSGEVTLTGDGAMLPPMIKAALERGLGAELPDHLGYDKGDPEARHFANSCNGTTSKTVATEVGDVRLDVPRDRDGTFTPMLVPKGARRPSGLDDMIISLYAGRMTIRDIAHHLVTTVGTELSHETISNIVDEVCKEVMAWQNRPLEAFYPVIYLDAIVVKVRDGAHVRNKAAHIAVGVDMDGIKHVLGIWIELAEGAKFRAGVCAELANRGVRDVLIVCCVGLTGLPDAIEATRLDRADLRGAPDPRRDAVHVQRRPQGRHDGAQTGLHRRQRRSGRASAGRVRGLAARGQVPARGRDLEERVGKVATIGTSKTPLSMTGVGCTDGVVSYTSNSCGSSRPGGMMWS